MYTYDSEPESKRRIKTMHLIKIFIHLKFKTVASKNNFDKTIYIKFEDVKKVLLKNLFKISGRTDFKVENPEFNKKLNKGWAQKVKKIRENKKYKNLIV